MEFLPDKEHGSVLLGREGFQSGRGFRGFITEVI